MGLDTHAARYEGEMFLDEADKQALEDASLPTVFRGKLYNEAIVSITGISLYQDWIPPESVAYMSYKLERAIELEYDMEPIVTFMRVCKERGLGLIGSW